MWQYWRQKLSSRGRRAREESAIGCAVRTRSSVALGLSNHCSRLRKPRAWETAGKTIRVKRERKWTIARRMAASVKLRRAVVVVVVNEVVQRRSVFSTFFWGNLPTNSVVVYIKFGLDIFASQIYFCMCTFATLLFVMVFLFLEWDLEMHMCHHHHTTIVTSWHQQQVVCHLVALPFTFKSKVKEEWWKFKCWWSLLTMLVSCFFVHSKALFHHFFVLFFCNSLYTFACHIVDELGIVYFFLVL